MQFLIEQLADYNREVKLKSGKISCYSKKELKNKYPEKTYTLVGETKKIAKENDKEGITAVYGPQTLLSVSNYKANSRLLWREAGYISVGGNRYIALLKSRLAFLWFFLIGLLSVGVCLCLLFNVKEEQPSVIDPIPEPDKNISAIPDGDSNISTDAGTLSMTYVLKAKVSLSTGEVGIYFANPQKSNQNVVIELYIVNGEENVLLAKSGQIPRGNRLFKLEAEKNTLSRLKVGDYEGFYRIICWDAESGGKSLVEPKITDVVITVIE